ncbi:Tim44 domain-containing protein [Ramlibacter ginsenosidimutans]|uniref:Tim44 domain-containing protein n=1 Tax=Ramlibacter ginsenosidimutans TaxID=502333 RepID=A0A934TX68_9BURK|nr:Tim44-like domain-containing protein [Ramlibacter ginsenosidimutans]MBK6009060.1 Tim44 domain-containing protein [Ramlibacter ginsenosidimutans]
MKLWTVLLAAALAVGAADADAARRLGGGGSIGRQSSNVTQRQSTSPAPATPTAPANAQRAPEPAGAPAAPPPRSRWGGMLGGLAAGLGLAALAHALGFGAAFGSVMLVVLLALLAMTAIAMLRRRAQPPAAAAAGPYQHSGLSADDPLSPRQYNPQKVGNDASARPWESGYDATHAQDAAEAVRIGSALRGSPEPAPGEPAWGIPAGFDTAAFLAAAKRNFVALQDAWDRADIAALRGMMTDEMLREIQAQLAERDRQPGPVQKTGVDLLEAQLLGIQDLPGEYMASVEFSGMIREDPSAGPAPFREVWNMTKPRDGSSGWLVAGVQALQ